MTVGIRKNQRIMAVLFQVNLIVQNNAGLNSSIYVSRPFTVLKGNVAGTVYDGRKLGIDVDFSDDR